MRRQSTAPSVHAPALHVLHSVQGDAQGIAVGSQGNQYVIDESHSERFPFGDYTFDYRAQLVNLGSAPDEVLLIHHDLGSGLTFEIECSD